MSFKHLFTPHNIRGMEIRNRIFSSGHQTILARDWLPTDEMAAYHEARAAGGVGLIVTEAARPHSDAVTTPSYIDASTDRCIPRPHRPWLRGLADGAICAIYGS